MHLKILGKRDKTTLSELLNSNPRLLCYRRVSGTGYRALTGASCISVWPRREGGGRGARGPGRGPGAWGPVGRGPGGLGAGGLGAWGPPADNVEVAEHAAVRWNAGRSTPPTSLSILSGLTRLFQLHSITFSLCILETAENYDSAMRRAPRCYLLLVTTHLGKRQRLALVCF